VKLKVVSHSHYPKIGESDAQLRLRRAFHAFDRKKIDLNELKKVQKEAIQTVIKEQTDNDLDVVTDGLILWNDPISPFMRHLEGVEIHGLLRFFDTNFYFRQPVITGRLKRKSSGLKEEISFLVRTAATETKAVLTGPYTLALLSKIETDIYKNVRDVVLALTPLVAEEIKTLAGTGVSQIQIEEPGYFLTRPDWACVREGFEMLAAQKGKAQIGLVTYFGDAAPLYGELQKFSADFIGLDCTYGFRLFDRIRKEGSRKDLLLGLLDGRNTKLEDPKAVLGILRDLGRFLPQKTIYATTSCGLEFLPRNRAFDKLGILKAIKHGYSEGA